MATAYEQLGSKLLTYTLIAMAAVSCFPIFIIFLITKMISVGQLFQFYVVMISLAMIIYFLYRKVHLSPKGKYILNGYSFLLSFTVLWFVPSSMAWLIMFMTLLFSLTYLSTRIMIVSTFYGLIVLGIHFVYNPNFHSIHKPIDLIVIFAMYVMCGASCISVCLFGGTVIRDALESERIAKINRDQSSEVLERVRQSLKTLTIFSKHLQERVYKGEEITAGNSNPFAEVSVGVDTKTLSVDGINRANELASQNIDLLRDNFISLENIFLNISRMTQDDDVKVTVLVQEISKIGQVVETTVSLLEKLDGQNKNIGKIVEVIQDISSQTNLLSLEDHHQRAREMVASFTELDLIVDNLNSIVS